MNTPTKKITRGLVSIYWQDMYEQDATPTSYNGDDYDHELGALHSEAVTACASLYRNHFRCWVVPFGEDWNSPNQLFNGQPQFPNQCSHCETSWYGHVELPTLGWADLWFFYRKDTVEGWHYCARYGRDGDYNSFPVLALSTLSRRDADPYAAHVAHYFIDFINHTTARERAT